MKTITFFCLLPALLLASCISTAQNSILAGKITDENNNPVAAAEIKLQYGSKIITSNTDKDGLYYTQEILPGNYRVSITAGGKKNVIKKIAIGESVKENKFYNFHIQQNKAIVEITSNDPFMAEKISELKNQDPHQIFLYGEKNKFGSIQLDSLGKIKRGYFPAAPAPSVK